MSKIYTNNLRCACLLFLFLLTGNKISSQNNTVNLMLSKKWLMHGNTLVNFATVPEIEMRDSLQREFRHCFTFLKNGKLEYRDMLNSYDPYEGGCSNSFRNYSGTWALKNNEVFVELEYNSVSEKRFLVYHYTVKIENANELALKPLKN